MKNKHLQKLVTQFTKISFIDGKMVLSQVAKTIKVLKTLPRRQAIEALSEYVKQFKRLARQHTMHVESATSLKESQLKKIKQAVEKKVPVTKITTRINPAILGGFKLQIGDQVWDQTLFSKANQIKEAIIYGRPD